MEVRERLYTVDDVWDLQRQPGNGDKSYELIHGELIEMAPANMLHFWLMAEIAGELRNFVRRHDQGFVGGEGGFSPPGDRHTLLATDVGFVRKGRMPQPIPQTFAGFMPDLAVEIMSPSNTLAELRDKAEIYLRNCATLVWIVITDDKRADVCRLVDGALQMKQVDANGALIGEEVLPGFRLEMRLLFPHASA